MLNNISDFLKLKQESKGVEMTVYEDGTENNLSLVLRAITKHQCTLRLLPKISYI